MRLTASILTIVYLLVGPVAAQSGSDYDYSFGAASRRNMEAMVAEPHHLGSPATDNARYAPKRDAAFRAYINRPEPRSQRNAASTRTNN